jgi:TetR/AcrR family fatty acid metabolism transcriptional regulator
MIREISMPRAVDKDAKRETIGRAAMKVFRDRGYHSARMADIALEAGIGKGTIYEYFRNKGEILRFEFGRFFQAFREGALEVLSRSDTPGSQLASLVEFALSHVEAWKEHCTVYIDYFSLARTQEGQDFFSLADIYGEMREILKSLIERGQAAGDVSIDYDPTATSDLLISLYDGVVLHDIFDRHQGALAGMRAEAVRLITRGLLSDDQDQGKPERDRVRH